MKFIISILFFVITLFGSLTYINAVDLGDALDQVTPDHLHKAGEYISEDTETLDGYGGAGIRSLIVNLGKKIMMPIILVIGLLLGIMALYKVMFTEDEAERKKALGFFTWGLFGILIMFSALFIGVELVGKDGLTGLLGENNIAVNTGGEIASDMYNTILKPFVGIFMYLMIGVLFLILLISILKMLSAPDKEETVTGAKTMIIWNIFGILVILSAASLVKLVYGGAANKGATDLGAVSEGAGALSTQDIGWFHNIINYFLGFVALLITIFIIYQAYLLLMKPDDEETLNALKRNFVYVLLGLLLMGGVYIIINFIIV